MIEEIYSSVINETCYKYTASNGVTVFMQPMKGYTSVTAQFTAKFGSQDNSFSTNGKDFIKVPDGTAHYLEHKLFESEECDAFKLFAQTGALCNAGTSFDYTQYYFSCSDKFEKNLEILLNFVQEPYFTAENVEKERGIIGQEITMYRDNPGWRVFTGLLDGLYSVNPVRNDIAGTVESIAEITEKTLYDCYNAYYNPANMYLFIAGNFEPDEAVSICERNLKKRPAFDIIPETYDEPDQVNRRRTLLQMPVAKPIFELGFKIPARDGMAGVEDNVYYNILFDILFGATSDFFEKAHNSGLLNDEFSVGVFKGRGHAFPLARGESGDPDKVLELMQLELAKSKKEPPSREDFERLKRASYGSMVRAYNSVDSTASHLADAGLGGVSPFAVINTAAGASYDKMLEMLAGFDENNAAISIVSSTDKL